MMKQIVRTGFEIVMLQEKKYTRDLYLCYFIFSKYFPDYEITMKSALSLAIQPSCDKNLITNSAVKLIELINENAKKYLENIVN
jgi:hypothetical protein